DHAKTKYRQKRGGQLLHVTLDENLIPAAQTADIVVHLDDALAKLEAFDARKAQVIELMYFAGLNHEAAAPVLGISHATVQREARLAKVWLFNHLNETGALAADPGTV